MTTETPITKSPEPTSCNTYAASPDAREAIDLLSSRILHFDARLQTLRNLLPTKMTPEQNEHITSLVFQLQRTLS